jgi:2-oxoglutarate dehydrogenase E2 component (dihydrolipoamide succinyltransferase)
MPQLGESITEGTVSRWLKRQGEQVEQYESLLEVTTDKVDSEIPSPAAGTLLEILVGEGTTVQVGALLARIGEAQPAHAASLVAVADQYDVEPGTLGAPAQLAPLPGNGQTPARPLGESPSRPWPPVSPLVARMLAEHQLQIEQIPGTGIGGRVRKQDVLRYLEKRESVRAFEHVSEPESAQLPSSQPEAVQALQRADAPPLQRANVQTLAEELVPLTPMRRAVAEHMLRSVQTAPHVTTFFELDLSRVVAHRERSRAEFEQAGARLTYTAYFVQAAVAALRAVPVLNGRYTEQGIVRQRRVHIGMAVALDEGLIVPVIRDADEKNLLGLARAVGDLAERARTRKLRADETQGGTFTISNHGTAGSLFSTPIINQPQSAILGVGALVKRPVVITHEGQDLITIRPMCYASLTYDHRLVDGATADAFMTAWKQALEQIV